MNLFSKLLIFIYLVILIFFTEKVSSDDLVYDSPNFHYINDWVIQITGGHAVAEKVARDYNYKNLGPVLGFNDTYLLRKKNHSRRTKRHCKNLTKQLNKDKRVVWAEQQIARVRVKREHLIDAQNIWSDPLARGIKELSSFDDHTFNDELWKHQWYLHDTRNVPTLPELDLKVRQVWKMGFTGKGIVVSVMDDGLEWNHTDIIKNYDPRASCDTNDNDPDPFPRYERSDSNNHGTRCAGEIAMANSNRKCGVGVAYDARIGGIRCLDGDVSDIVEAMSIGFNNHYIDIYSSSWGPSDDGLTVDGPKHFASEALYKGVTYGRKGRGCIYVWASGNGGMKGDNCNCDGYVSSIYTLSIGSASQQGQFPWYGERCSSTMAVAYSSGSYTDPKVATTDLHNRCTIDHSGTSAAAPLVAGIIALALQANPNLTWRDVQHLVAWTSEFFPLMENKGWKRNGIGLLYNCRFGFGLINSEELVKAALKWTNVPRKTICYIQARAKFPIPMESGSEISILFIDDIDCPINYLEHVQINLNVEYTKRGNLDIFLISPKGSISMLLSRRPLDTSVLGFRNWNLTSVHFWGENPRGQWRMLIRDKEGNGHRGTIKNVFLILHGTELIPEHLKYGYRKYKQEDVIKDTLDPTPEHLEGDMFDQDQVKNSLHPLNNPSHFDWISEIVGNPSVKNIDE